MVGRSLLHYEMISRLGAGGMGEVWLARDTKLDREVAIKVLPADASRSAVQRERLVREARAASSLVHPNIITIHEINSADGLDFIVMEYVRGETLAVLLERGPLPAPRAVEYAIQVCEALATAHRADVVHRDLKPGNIMITPTGLVKVLDFGIAKRVFGGVAGSDQTTVAALTEQGVSIGTPAYMSPEQTLGDAVDARSDLFSFGTVLYEMLSRTLPFQATTNLTLIRQIVHDPPRPLREVAPDVPESVVRIVGRCLEKEPAARYASAEDVAAALRAALPGIAPNPVAAVIDQQPRRRARGRGGVVIALGLFAVMLLGLRGPALLTWVRSVLTSASVSDADASPAELYRRGTEALHTYYRDRNGNLDKAISQLELALQKKPNYPQAEARLSLAYWRRNSISRDPEWQKRAVAHAEAAVKGDEMLAIAHIAYGAALAINGDNDKAAAAFARAETLEPGNPELLWRQGDLAVARRDPEAAERHYRLAVASSRDWEAHLRYGGFLYRAARYEEAIDAFEKASSFAPDHPRPYSNLGAVYHQLGRVNDAAAMFQRALDIAPDELIYSNLGTLLYFQGKYEASERAFDQAVKLGANNYLRWGNLADAVRMTARGSEKMHDSYRRAIQLARERLQSGSSPSAANETRSSMAVYLARDGQTKEAATELEILLSEKSLAPGSLHNAALVAELTNQRAKAIDLLSRSLAGGYKLREIQQEPDFVKLRTDPAYHLLASKYEK